MRMIMKVLQEVREFLVVIVIAIAGFGFAINVALGADYREAGTFNSPLKAMYWITKTGVYQFDADAHEADVSGHPDGVLLFEIMMFAIALLLLNLLIAIMNSARAPLAPSPMEGAAHAARRRRRAEVEHHPT